jgi:translation initiation factor eIF-2B subunit epsilon
LVNAPLLDYTLEWLAVNAVEEVFVFCCAHAEQVEAHLAAAGWLRRRKMVVHSVVATNCLSAGDALRLLDHRDIIKNDFILVSGDVVSNARLAPALEAHRRRRAADKSALLTLVMRGGVGEAQRRRLGATEITAVVDPHTKRLLKVGVLAAATAGGVARCWGAH